MSKLANFLGAVALAGLLAAAPARAADQSAPGQGLPDAAEQAIREGAEKILNALRLLIGSVPQYEMPEVLPNGDIIIRRKHPEPAPDAKPAPPRRGGDQTRT